jgi:biopolymer transport protein ExbD
MAGNVSGEIKAEPNLTPLLDVVFQLITFFMLVFRISSDNFDSRVHLPVAGAARPLDASAVDLDILVLNIDQDGRLLWNGQVLDIEGAIKEIRRQGNLARTNLKVTKKQELKEGDPLPTTVVFRADRRVPFSTVYRYISSCQQNGFTKFALKAMNAEG